ncbi:meiosis-specific serine/threonine-protein kinase mek1, partial [Colletotrichum scovillei]
METESPFPLAAATKACLESFCHLVSILETRKDFQHKELSAELAKNQRDRFKVWAAGLGALANGNASLDFRLMEASLVKDTILRFLADLDTFICRTFADDLIVNGSSKPVEEAFCVTRDDDSESSDGSVSAETIQYDDVKNNVQSEIGYNSSRIDQTLAALVKISFQIRGSSSRTTQLNQRALSYKEPPNPEDPSVLDILGGYSYFDYRHVEEYFRLVRKETTDQSREQSYGQSHEPPPSSVPFMEPENSFGLYLVQRWGKSITDRRRVFAYWRRHARKLARDEFPSAIRDIKQTMPLVSPSEVYGEDAEHVRLSLPSQPKLVPLAPTGPAFDSVSPTIYSGTEASRPISGDLSADTDSVVSYCSTALDLSGNATELPPSPVVGGGQKEFICPCCCVVCPAKEGKDKRWREHILRDLRPYMCTYDQCDEDEVMYSSRFAWVDHESQAHRRVWRCFEHHDLFKTQAGLAKHLHSSHPSLGESQIETLAELSHASIKDERQLCPFCLTCVWDSIFVDCVRPLSHLVNQEAVTKLEFLDGQTEKISAAIILSTPRVRDYHGRGRTNIKESHAQAVKTGHAELFRKMKLRRGDEGAELLCLATEVEDLSIMSFLLANGADPNFTDGTRTTPLWIAAGKGYFEATQRLVEAGAQVDMINHADQSPLFIAAAEGHVNVVQYLLKCGADSNWEDRDSRTPLAFAFCKRHEDVVRLLMEYAAPRY